jgi:hypothetical protein
MIERLRNDEGMEKRLNNIPSVTSAKKERNLDLKMYTIPKLLWFFHHNTSSQTLFI